MLILLPLGLTRPAAADSASAFESSFLTLLRPLARAVQLAAPVEICVPLLRTVNCF
jgi:hypothetical protein